MSAGVAAGHPATAEVGLRTLAAGGSAADAAVAAMLACCVAESILTGIGGGGFATYYEAATRHGDLPGLLLLGPRPGQRRQGRPDGADRGVLRRRADELPDRWRLGGGARRAGRRRRGPPPLGPAAVAARRRAGDHAWPPAGWCCPAAQARTLLVGGARADARATGRRSTPPAAGCCRAATCCTTRGWTRRSAMLAEHGPGPVLHRAGRCELIVEAVREAGGCLGPDDLAAYRVAERAGGQRPAGRTHGVPPAPTSTHTIATIAALPARIATMRRGRAGGRAGQGAAAQRPRPARRHVQHLGGRRRTATPA